MSAPPQPRPHGVAPAISISGPLFLENLMSRLQLGPPFPDNNSFLSRSLDDYLLPSDEDEDDDIAEDDDIDRSGDGEDVRLRRMLVKEEAKLEREIIRIIRAGRADEALKPNSGDSVAMGNRSICVAFHEDRSGEYRVWEWHGHIMIFDPEDGYSAEYIYGNYYERLADARNCSRVVVEEEEQQLPKEEEEQQLSKEAEEENGDEIGRDLGLRGLIAGDSLKGGSGGGRVLHRNAIKIGSSSAPATE